MNACATKEGKEEGKGEKERERGTYNERILKNTWWSKPSKSHEEKPKESSSLPIIFLRFLISISEGK